MSEPRTSVVIPAYNAEKTLATTLESLQAQTMPAWEAVVVDDGSTDGTMEVAKGFRARDERFRVVTRANGGEPAARNAGLPLARAEWLSFLDADDWVRPTYLERLTSTATAAPDIGLVHCGWVRVSIDGREGEPAFAPDAQDMFPVLALRNCFVVHACLLRRSVVDSVGPFDESLKTCSDWDFWQRVARTGPRFAAVPEALACYRLRPSSAGMAATQMLTDALTIIARGCAPDPRVHAPAPAYAPGMPDEARAAAGLAFACWTAGLAIGQGESAEPLLDLLEKRAAISAESVADALFVAIPIPTGRLTAVWGYIWPRVEDRIDRFLARLETYTGDRGLAMQAKSHLMHQILRWAMPDFLRQHASFVQSLEPPVNADARPIDWKRLAFERGQQVDEQRAWMRDLDAAKTWQEEQARAWERVSADLQKELAVREATLAATAARLGTAETRLRTVEAQLAMSEAQLAAIRERHWRNRLARAWATLGRRRGHA